MAEGRAQVIFTATPEMAADDRGLVHGGFVFGLADHAAMLAINHPNVVLGKAEMKFLAPVTVGEALIAEARSGERQGAKIPVAVEVRRQSGGSEGSGGGGEVVAAGELICFAPERHVLDSRKSSREETR